MHRSPTDMISASTFRVLVPALLGTLASLCTPAARATEQPFTAPAWLFPIDTAASPSGTATAHDSRLSVPDSDMTYTRAQIDDAFAPPDWHPHDHGPMPAIVAAGRRPAVMACAFCHTPTGQGRPENSPLAGLPADYIERQLTDMRSGARRAAAPAKYLPVAAMHELAAALTDTDIRDAAQYFSQQVLRQRVEVIEAASIPEVKPAAWIYSRAADGAQEPLGSRILEVAPDFARHERRDDRMHYIAYVPPGSVERGRTLVTSGAGVTQACAGCHDVDLHGTPLGPPIAGRSPSYLLRQLLAFRRQARTGGRAQMMQPVVEKLTLDDMIAIVAYAASLPPH